MGKTYDLGEREAVLADVRQKKGVVKSLIEKLRTNCELQPAIETLSLSIAGPMGTARADVETDLQANSDTKSVQHEALRKQAGALAIETAECQRQVELARVLCSMHKAVDSVDYDLSIPEIKGALVKAVAQALA